MSRVGTMRFLTGMNIGVDSSRNNFYGDIKFKRNPQTQG